MSDFQEQGEKRTQRVRRERTDRGPRKPREDDKGTVMDCLVCGQGFFSRWEAKPRIRESDPIEKPPAGALICDRCVTNRLFNRNMAILNGETS